MSSSRRYKQDIQPMGDASTPLMQLHPVTFRYRQPAANGARPLQYGLIGDEVAKAMPALAIYDDQGQPDSVDYQILPNLRFNEYQKQTRDLSAAKAALGATTAELRNATTRLHALEAEAFQMRQMKVKLASAETVSTQNASAH